MEDFDFSELPLHLQTHIVEKLTYKEFARFDETSRLAHEICHARKYSFEYVVPQIFVEETEITVSVLHYDVEPYKPYEFFRNLPVRFTAQNLVLSGQIPSATMSEISLLFEKNGTRGKVLKLKDEIKFKPDDLERLIEDIMSENGEPSLSDAVLRLREIRESSPDDAPSDSGSRGSSSDTEEHRRDRKKFTRERDVHRQSVSPIRTPRSVHSEQEDNDDVEEHQDLSDYVHIHVPPAPKRPSSSSRQLVALSSNHRVQFEEWAKGKFLSTVERTTLLADLPVPDSPFALSPVVDQELRGIAKDLRRSDRVEVFVQDVDTIYDLGLNSLNILALVKALGNREDISLPKEVIAYLDLQGELLGAMIKQGIVWKREVLLKQLGIPRSAVPSMKTVEIDSPTVQERDGSLRPEIFGKILREELLKADNPTRRAIDRLKSSKSSSSSTRKIQGQSTPSKFASGRIDKNSRRSTGQREGTSGDRNRSSASSRPGPSRGSSSSAKGQSSKKKF